MPNSNGGNIKWTYEFDKKCLEQYTPWMRCENKAETCFASTDIEGVNSPGSEI
jgi:hypothetical protein